MFDISLLPFLFVVSLIVGQPAVPVWRKLIFSVSGVDVLPVEVLNEHRTGLVLLEEDTGLRLQLHWRERIQYPQIVFQPQLLANGA